jgi:Fur family ferric uptake transcriptional regulator
MTDAPARQALAFQHVEDVTEALRAAGHRVSRPARAVLDALFSADGPTSAEQIAEGLGGRLEPLDASSVYRNLERLEQLGVVRHLHVGHGAGLYALARDGDREYLVCERCARVTSLDPAALDSLRESVFRAFGHHARFGHFPMHGFCAECLGHVETGPGDHARPQAHPHPHPHEH